MKISFLLTCRACTTNLVGLDHILLCISLDYYLKKDFMVNWYTEHLSTQLSEKLCILLNISFVKNLKNYHLTYFHYLTSSSHFSRVVTVFCFSSYFVHNCLLPTIPDTFAYEVDVPYELDHSILLALLDSNRATVKEWFYYVNNFMWFNFSSAQPKIHVTVWRVLPFFQVFDW